MRFVPDSRSARSALVLGALAVLVGLLVWRGPDFGRLADAFRAVEWGWVAVAVLLNLYSIVVRSSAWRVVITHACARPWPSRRTVFSAFSIGLLGNAVLPGRVGEIARVAVVTRRLRRPGAWPALVGTIFTHRLFDVVAMGGLVIYVLYTARIPDWAVPILGVFIGVGVGLLIASLLLARRHHRPFTEELGPIRRVLRTARYGLNVLRQPVAALEALTFQLLAWAAQFFAVWAAFQAFGIDEGFAAAGLVFLIMNIVTVFPFWPGNVGLVQAAIALVLLPYGVDYAHGFAYGIGLQAIEAGVGMLLGFAFLAREGYSFAMLRRMPEVTEVEIDESEKVERIG
jgi:glycosyltransferase 2 family protein